MLLYDITVFLYSFFAQNISINVRAHAYTNKVFNILVFFIFYSIIFAVSL